MPIGQVQKIETVMAFLFPDCKQGWNEPQIRTCPVSHPVIDSGSGDKALSKSFLYSTFCISLLCRSGQIMMRKPVSALALWN